MTAKAADNSYRLCSYNLTGYHKQIEILAGTSLPDCVSTSSLGHSSRSAVTELGPVASLCTSAAVTQ